MRRSVRAFAARRVDIVEELDKNEDHTLLSIHQHGVFIRNISTFAINIEISCTGQIYSYMYNVHVCTYAFVLSRKKCLTYFTFEAVFILCSKWLTHV